MDPVWQNTPDDILRIIAIHSDIDTRRALGFGHLRIPLPVTDFSLPIAPRVIISFKEGCTLVNFEDASYAVKYNRLGIRHLWRFGPRLYDFASGKTTTSTFFNTPNNMWHPIKHIYSQKLFQPHQTTNNMCQHTNINISKTFSTSQTTNILPHITNINISKTFSTSQTTNNKQQTTNNKH